MERGKTAEPFALRLGDRLKLLFWASDDHWNRDAAMAARIVLLAADGYGARMIANQLGVADRTVDATLRRYSGAGIPGLLHDFWIRGEDEAPAERRARRG